MDGTGAASNTRPNARQPTKPNTRPAEISNTRQPVQVINCADDNGDLPNTRQRIDVHLNRRRQIHVRRSTLRRLSTMRRNFSASKPIGTSMDGQYVNGSCDLSEIEPGATSAKSRPNSRRRLADNQAKAEPRKPAPKLSETDYLLSLWQSDCAELRQAGLPLRLEKAEVASPY